LQEDKKKSLTPKTAIVAGLVIAVIFSPACYKLLLRVHLDVLQWVIYVRFIYWAEVAFLWWYATQLEEQPLLIWKQKSSGTKFILMWTFLLCLLIVAASLISNITTLLGYHQNKELLRQISRFMDGRYFLVAFVSITAGITEEIIFRGYILTRLSILFKNQYVPIVLSAFIFSLMHYTYNSAHEFLFTFLIGIIFAIHYKTYGNLKPIIIAHCLIDWGANTFLHYFVK